MRGVSLLFGLAVSCGAGPLRAALPVSDEEFVGPFPSWRNVQRDYGAVGDDRADDTRALQHALNDLTKHTNFCVVFVPAGVYRLTETLKTVRREHTDCQGVAVVGEDPDRAVLRWDGAAGGTLFQWDAWYSKLTRLSLDGAGRARVTLQVGPAFSTYNETSDMVFRDAAIGILFGNEQTQGQAENEVVRCRFLNCTEAGVMTRNWNSMDIWVWYSRFEDCGYGLLNVMGNFHAWENLFRRSRVADVAIKNLMVFSIVNNTSMDSRRFLDFDTGHTWGAPTSIAGNRIVHPRDDLPLKLGNAGPYLVMDNAFALPSGSTNRAAQMTWADQTFLGNRYTRTNAVVERGRFRRVAERVVSPSAIDTNAPALPPTPPRFARQVIEVAPRSERRGHSAGPQRGGEVEGPAARGSSTDGSFSYKTSPQAPLVAIDGFQGCFTLASSMLMPVDSTNTCRVEICGNGRGSRALALNDLFWVSEPGITAERVWLNRATPPARGGLLGCIINSGTKGVAQDGFAFLESIGDSPDLARSRQGSGPLGNVGGVDDASLLAHLAPLRQARIWLPGPVPTGATDLRLYRVMATGGARATMEIRND